MTTKSQAKRLAVLCAVCPDVPGDGWKQQGVTHCKDCHTTWPLSRTRQQHCVRCHESFGGDEAATRHLDRQGNCVDPASVLHKVSQRRILSQNAEGIWVRAFGA